MLTFFDFPAEHWIHLRTSNPIESTFSTVKAQTKKIKGAGSRKAGLAMAFKLLLAAEEHWRRVNAPHLVALVKAGVEFPDGEAEMFQPEPAPEICSRTPHRCSLPARWRSTRFDNISAQRPLIMMFRAIASQFRLGEGNHILPAKNNRKTERQDIGGRLQ